MTPQISHPIRVFLHYSIAATGVTTTDMRATIPLSLHNRESQSGRDWYELKELLPEGHADELQVCGHLRVSWAILNNGIDELYKGIELAVAKVESPMPLVARLPEWEGKSSLDSSFELMSPSPGVVRNLKSVGSPVTPTPSTPSRVNDQIRGDLVDAERKVLSLKIQLQEALDREAELQRDVEVAKSMAECEAETALALAESLGGICDDILSKPGRPETAGMAIVERLSCSDVGVARRPVALQDLRQLRSDAAAAVQEWRHRIEGSLERDEDSTAADNTDAPPVPMYRGALLEIVNDPRFEEVTNIAVTIASGSSPYFSDFALSIVWPKADETNRAV